jgi:hypothetical protein
VTEHLNVQNLIKIQTNLYRSRFKSREIVSHGIVEVKEHPILNGYPPKRTTARELLPRSASTTTFIKGLVHYYLNSFFSRPCKSRAESLNVAFEARKVLQTHLTYLRSLQKDLKMKELCALCFEIIFCEKDNSRSMTELQVSAKACPFCETFYERMLEQCPKGSSDLICQFEGRTFKDGFVQLNMIIVSEKEDQSKAAIDDTVPSSGMISHWRIAYLECRLEHVADLHGLCLTVFMQGNYRDPRNHLRKKSFIVPIGSPESWILQLDLV